MFEKILKNKYKYLTEYFEAAVKNETHHLPHSIILYGLDTLAQYFFALNIAKILNCKKTKEYDCTCTNCKWISENRHPAVVTVSKWDYKPSNDDTKKVISVAQVRNIKNMISNTSNFHRVFIFCDIETNELSPQQKKTLEVFSDCSFKFPPNENGEERSWFPLPLTNITLPEITANALLKSIEEPPENVTFIFLTRDKNDLISTVVSRSQSFHVPSFSIQDFSNTFIDELMQDYPCADPIMAIQKANKFLIYSEENNINLQYLFCSMQDFLQRMIILNSANKEIFFKTKQDILHIAQAQKELSSFVDERNLCEALFLKFAIY